MDLFMDLTTSPHRPAFLPNFFAATSPATILSPDTSNSVSWCPYYDPQKSNSTPLDLSSIPDVSNHSQYNSTPQDYQDAHLTRIYPSPPLTGSKLKQSVPLPELFGCSGMGISAETDPQHSTSGSTSLCEHVSSSSFVQTFATTIQEPLSPPPSTRLKFSSLEPSDHDEVASHLDAIHPLSSNDHESEQSSSTTKGRPFVEEIGIPPVEDSSHRSYHQLPSPSSPTDSWGHHSVTSEDSSTTYSPGDDEDRKSCFDWDSDSMEWSSSCSDIHEDAFAPHSLENKLDSFDFHSLDPLGSSTLRNFYPEPPPDPHSASPTLFQPHSASSNWNLTRYGCSMNIASISPPVSPRVGLFHLPSVDVDSEQTDTVMPPDDDDNSLYIPPSSPSHRQFQALPDLYGDSLYLTPIPRSPHAGHSLLPDIDMDDSFEPPPSPCSPHQTLPEITEDDGFIYPSDGTISPSLISPPPHEGLGLFIQPSSIDPPLARSPSPSDDDLQFLDIQLDPTSSNLDNDEFLQLRALRRRALEAERSARTWEATLSERVTEASNALLPSSLIEAGVMNDSSAKRSRKQELHAAMDLRAEARRHRKQEKQKSKEIGALLELKMDNGFGMDTYDLDRSTGLNHLVASMIFKRREAFRALTNRKAACVNRPYLSSSLSCSVSMEDLSEAFEASMEVD